MQPVITLPGAGDNPPGALMAPKPTSWKNTLVAGSLLLFISIAWVAAMITLSTPRELIDLNGLALHGTATLLVFALLLVFWRYRRSADIPLTLTAGGLLYLFTDLLDTLNAAYRLPAPLSDALATGALTLPAALIAIAGIVQWTARSQTALRRQRRLNRRLTALNEMMRTLNVSADHVTVARTVLDEAMRVLQADSGTVLLADPATGELEFVAAAGAQGEQLIGVRLPPGTGLAGWAARQGRPVRVGNAQADSRFYAGVDRMIGQTTRAVLAVPIRAREGTLGVIELINHGSTARPRVDEFTEDDQFFVDLLAQSAAAAFDNARAYAENQARLRVLQTLYEVNAVITSSVSRVEILEQLTRQITRAVDAGGAIISGWHENAVSLEPIAHFRADRSLPWEHTAPARDLLADYPLTIEVLRDQVARSVRADDPQADAAERALLAARGAQSALLMPLVVKNRTIGLIEVLLAHPSRVFSGDEIDLVRAISNEAALAIENALLFEELRARAERLGHAYAELQAADRARRDLVSNVAHDLGAPLTFIKGYTELLLAGDLGALTPEQRDALEVITRKADGLTQLVTDLVTLERAERKAPEPVPCDLVRLVRDAVRTVEPNAAQAGVIVRADVPPDLPPALAEAGRISQVLDNLLSNALKFTPAGGTITVTLRDTGDMLQAAVTDSGIGIPAAQQARIFERFYQVGSASGSRAAPGSGLGLSICQAIITSHGGRIWLESDEGRGSTFYFTLPKA